MSRAWFTVRPAALLQRVQLRIGHAWLMLEQMVGRLVGDIKRKRVRLPKPQPVSRLANSLPLGESAVRLALARTRRPSTRSAGTCGSRCPPLANSLLEARLLLLDARHLRWRKHSVVQRTRQPQAEAHPGPRERALTLRASSCSSP